MKKLIVFLAISMLFISCAKETIEPAFAPQTFKQQRGGKPIVVDYPIRNLEVDRVGNDIGDVPVVGGVFQRLAEVLADITISNDSGVDGMEVPIEPQVFNVAELDEVDFDYIESVSLEAVKLRVAETLEDIPVGEGDDATRGLNFINKVQVIMALEQVPDNPNEVDRVNDDRPDRVVTNDNAGSNNNGEDTIDIYGDTATDVRNDVVVDTPSSDVTVLRDVNPTDDGRVREDETNQPQAANEILVLSYDKKKDRGACSGDCIDMKVHNHNWKQILKLNRKFTIKVKLFIEGVPKESLKLDGRIRFSVGVNPGF
ncbi:MAG: hypothetical protein EP326_15805 [Deltaproteobacteria bacterium]|nr:MAG: hypothetical protein EP326_15805 [Deltaproteobacteria bacterium]